MSIFNKKKSHRSKAPPKETVPEVIDFSSVAIKKAVISQILQNPVTLYSGSGSLLSLLWMAAFGFSVVPFFFLTGLSAISTGSLIVNKFFRQDEFELKHVQMLRKALDEQAERAIVNLKEDLTTFKCEEGDEADEAVRQVDVIKRKYESLVSVLQRKLKPGELAYDRFLGMAAAIYKSVLDNLRDIAACIDSVDEIDPDRIRSEIKRSNNSSKKKSALEETLQLRESQMSKVRELLEQNTIAMTSLDKTSADISKIKVTGGVIDMETAMEELVRLGKLLRNFKPSATN